MYSSVFHSVLHSQQLHRLWNVAIKQRRSASDSMFEIDSYVSIWHLRQHFLLTATKEKLYGSFISEKKKIEEFVCFNGLLQFSNVRKPETERERASWGKHLSNLCKALQPSSQHIFSVYSVLSTVIYWTVCMCVLSLEKYNFLNALHLMSH